MTDPERRDVIPRYHLPDRRLDIPCTALNGSVASRTANSDLGPTERACVALGARLRAAGYEFVTVTPQTHGLVNARAGNELARSVVDVFGWSRPFGAGVLSPELMALAHEAGILTRRGDFWQSEVRWSTLGEQLFMHSAYPTRDKNAVFFGPDSYRFASLIKREVGTGGRIVDVGCGAGVGGLCLAKQAVTVALADISANALRHAAINAGVNACADRVTLHESDILSAVPGVFDVIVANPPFLVDAGSRTYRHGGGRWGCDLAVRMVEECLPRLAAGGRFVLYCGTAFRAGEAVLRQDLFRVMQQAPAGSWTWDELDPDIFADELCHAPYDGADRIAAVAVMFTRDRGLT